MCHLTRLAVHSQLLSIRTQDCMASSTATACFAKRRPEWAPAPLHEGLQISPHDSLQGGRKPCPLCGRSKSWWESLHPLFRYRLWRGLRSIAIRVSRTIARRTLAKACPPVSAPCACGPRGRCRPAQEEEQNAHAGSMRAWVTPCTYSLTSHVRAGTVATAFAPSRTLRVWTCPSTCAL